MSFLPRLAVGSVQDNGDCRAVLWGLLDLFDRCELRVQTFLSRGCLQRLEAATVVTGIAPRHLDSWLMTAEACRERFVRAARLADLSVVEGSFADGADYDDSGEPAGSRLSTLCRWLGLPRLGVIDLSNIAGFEVPSSMPDVDALLIDHIGCECDFYRWQTILESLWGIPVLGGLESAPALRSAIGQLQSHRPPPRDLCEKLGGLMSRYVRPSQILELASRNSWSGPTFRSCAATRAPAQLSACRLDRLEPRTEPPASITVAIAYDDAFFGYCPDALDVLEQRGVTVRDFSPLRDESLPADADMVYIGCGRPDLHAEQLSENFCLLLALRDHVCAGKRIYAEGGGLAYLCQQLALPSGERVPMTGILPAVAHANQQPDKPRPVELTLAKDHWLGHHGRRVRGYLSERWRLEPVGALSTCVAEPQHRLDLVERHQAVGSRVHLNLALQPVLLESFLRPAPAALAWAMPTV
jgi:cobyrinic acid a,c-diamide synthase